MTIIASYLKCFLALSSLGSLLRLLTYVCIFHFDLCQRVVWVVLGVGVGGDPVLVEFGDLHADLFLFMFELAVHLGLVAEGRAVRYWWVR